MAFVGYFGAQCWYSYQSVANTDNQKNFSKPEILYVLCINLIVTLMIAAPEVNLILEFVSKNTFINLYVVLTAYLYEPYNEVEDEFSIDVDELDQPVGTSPSKKTDESDDRAEKFEMVKLQVSNDSD